LETKKLPFYYKLLVFVDCALTLVILFVFIKVIPTFAEVFWGFDAKLALTTYLVIGTSNFIRTIPGGLICLIGLVSLALGIKRKVAFKYWVILFCLLLLLLFILVIGMFSSQGGLGNAIN
jgi:type II secretory pathway component PulF